MDDNWSEGTVNDKKGIFPIVYVEIVEEGERGGDIRGVVMLGEGT